VRGVNERGEARRGSAELAAVVADNVPVDGTVLVIARGDTELLSALERDAWPVPRGADGAWSGYYPEHDTAAISQIEALRALGGQFLLVPEFSRWWLEHYAGLARHLTSRYERLAPEQDAYVLFDLREQRSAPWPELLGDQVQAFWLRTGRLPTVLDWGTELGLIDALPQLAVFSPPSLEAPLPYLDASADIVAVRGGDESRLREAARVAAALTARFGPGDAIEFDRRRGQSPEPPSIALFANAAAPEARLRETFDGELVSLPSGPGFAASVNRAAAALDADLLAILSEDAVLLPGWTRAAIHTLSTRPAAGAAAGRLLAADGSRLQSGAPPGSWHRQAEAPLFDTVHAVERCAAGLLVTPRSLFVELGGFDEETATPYDGYVRKLAARDLLSYEHPEINVVALGRTSAPAGDRTPASSRAPVVVRPPTGRKRALIISDVAPSGRRDGSPRRLLDHVEALAEGGFHTAFLALEGVPRGAAAQPLVDRGTSMYEPSGSWLEHVLSGGELDLALFSRWQLAEHYVPVLREASPTTRIVVDAIGLDLVRDARRGLARRERDGVRGVLDDDYASTLLGELNVYAAVDGVLTTCAGDTAIVRELTGDRGLAHTVAPVADPVRGRPFERRAGILFAGCAEHAPDVGAAEWLWDEVLPRLDPQLLQDHPLYVVGGGLERFWPGTASSRAGVRLAGSVPSLTPYLAGARALICPMPFAAGAQHNVAAALAAGLPVVTTPAGADGLEVRDGVDVLVAEHADEFAQATARLLGDRALWRRLAGRGRSRAAHYRRAEVNRALLAAVRLSLARDVAPAVLPAPDPERLARRRTHAENQRIIAPVRAALRRVIDQEATVLVVTDGSRELLRLEPRPAWPFPQGPDGHYTPYHPHDSEALIDHLEELAGRGADYLLFCRPQQWWLSYYPEFHDFLRNHYPVVAEEEQFLLFDLAPARSKVTVPATRPPEPVARSLPARLIAFYLPQFHPIPENDRWWGEGFTEWTNVGRADPLFTGHEQPHIPGELGFYDLRLSETRAAQAELASEYGIHAFCYYHYWFGGKLLLERPFDEVLASGEPDFPFCLCWANEPWSRRWDGSPHDVLQVQPYSREDDLAHIAWLLPALADPRAVTVDGKPMFLVYRARSLPDPARTTDTWRREVRRAGLPGIHLVAVETARDPGWDATQVGFDAKLHFAPQFGLLPGLAQAKRNGHGPGPRVYDYELASKVLADPEPVPYPRYETVCPRWDNTPRSGRSGLVLHGSSPEAYGRWLSQAVERAQRHSPNRRLVFVNAWNEWGEGCHLEPDVAHGRAYLEATRAALLEASTDAGAETVGASR
jgi:Glycosyltransferase WbsX/Glycosyl transferases group 1